MKSPRNTEGSSFAKATADKGFTLLELLAAMAVLAVMIVMLFAAFSQASSAWLQSESRVETFNQARAALDYMSRELAQAIVTSNGPPNGLQGLQFLGNMNSLAFITPVNDSSGGADLMEVVYRLSYKVDNKDPIFTDSIGTVPVKLVRRVSTSSSGANCEKYYASGVGGSGTGCTNAWDLYFSADWPETSDFNNTAVLAENVVSLNFMFLGTNGVSYPYWNSTENRGVPLGLLPNLYTPWKEETGGIPFNLFSNEAQYMTNHAPVGVFITIGVIDSHAVTRLKAIAGPTLAGVGTPPWVAVTNQATKYFTTFVSIPNSQP